MTVNRNEIREKYNDFWFVSSDKFTLVNFVLRQSSFMLRMRKLNVYNEPEI
jgi:hypothetical protein